MTKQTLKDDLKQSMLAKDSERTSVLRMLLSAVGYYEIEKGGAGYEASEEDIETVLQKQAKQRRDSIEQYTSGGRADLAAKEQQELGMIEKYLPEQMSEEEITKHVEEALKTTGATSPQDMGKVMGALMPKTKGKADGAVVSRIVREKLQN